MSHKNEPVVVTQNLTKRYGEFVALDNLSISLNRGQILGFIGPNGAGKTTTIKILVGLSRPTSGTATIAGADCVRDARKIKRMVGYMPDVFGSYENMRVTEYLDFFGATFSIPRKERIKRVQEVLDTTGSTYMKDKYVESLSHGMKQRVAIARTLLHDPELVILDEPANGLDPQARIEMREIILRLADMGKTIIVTSHILPELSRICNQVAIVIKGKLQAFGPLSQIMHDLTQLRTIEVQLANAGEIKPAAQVIRKVTGEKHKMTGSKAESMIRFQTEKLDSELSVVLAALVSKGIHVVQFRELQTDLEDAFMSITQKSNESDKAATSANDSDGMELEEVEEVSR